MQGGTECGVHGQLGVIGGAVKAAEEALSKITHIPVARVHSQDGGLVATRLRIGGRPAHDLRPVGGQPLDVLRVLVGMRERMVELGVLHALEAAGYILPLAYGALAARWLATTLGPELLLGGASQRVLAVGFDEGDSIGVGFLRSEGLVFPEE